MDDDTRIKLLRMIHTRAFKEGKFTLTSGVTSDYYIDCKEIILDAEGLLLVGKMILDKIKEWEATAVGGMELGSVPISTGVSLISATEGWPLDNFIIRKSAKEHGTGKKIEGKLLPGTRVVVVEDVVSSGSSALKVIDVVREAGAVVAGVVCIVDREMSGADAIRAKDVLYEPLFTITEIKEFDPS